MNIYTHPWSRGFSIGWCKEGASRIHIFLWRWEWSRWFSAEKIDDNHVETFFKRKITEAVDECERLREENKRLKEQVIPRPKYWNEY